MRRYKEMLAKGEKVDLAELENKSLSATNRTANAKLLRLNRLTTPNFLILPI